VTSQGPRALQRATPVEAALRRLGARKYGSIVEVIEEAITLPAAPTGLILAPLVEATAVLQDWAVSDRAQALLAVIKQGIADPQVVSPAQMRRRHVLLAAFRLPDEELEEEWGASLTDRFKQLKKLRIFAEVTSTQPMEMSWKRGVERLAHRLEERLGELRTPEDWAPYRPVQSTNARPTGPTAFRRPSEGAQKLVVNLFVMTVVMKGRAESRRITERLITSQDEDGLRYYAASAYSSGIALEGRRYVPTRALWGCRAERGGGQFGTRLWFPRPLQAGEKAHFASEVVLDTDQDDPLGWHNVDVDHYGIEAGELRDGLLPVSGLTIRIKFESDHLPTAVWWYAELNERERYVEPPIGSPRRLHIVCGDVVKTFEEPCQPRENYGIAYRWATDDRNHEKRPAGPSGTAPQVS
jgi:hypothetical protein